MWFPSPLYLILLIGLYFIPVSHHLTCVPAAIKEGLVHEAYRDTPLGVGLCQCSESDCRVSTLAHPTKLSVL